MIPKIIHQIWLQGYNNIPSELNEFHDKCKKVNSDFEHMFWDNDRIKKLLEEEFGEKYVAAFDYFKIFAQKADFARYAILYVYGGIYLDMDTMCKKNLNDFLNYRLFTTIAGDSFYELYKRYHNAVIGAVPRHPLFLIMFKNIFDRMEYANNVTYSTGTRLFYDSIQEYLKTFENDITIIDPKYLHPCGIHSNPECADNCDECYIVHTNHSSWSPTAKAIKYICKNIFIILIIVILIILLIFYFKNRNIN
ncbi:glycosyl transferase [Tupanvirus deep ocean]|uniref:Glycosyl transferase n=2 Tax=Tupanvirus TaxID=2094720 RepID=A0AC62A8A3_9VIRU|nr:glycosyl transferase [Tupanvirus deep ocean]QKU33949.1 glycosyl transferase [Tupanvirus deep ocean]